jgi:hypothetical protein
MNSDGRSLAFFVFSEGGGRNAVRLATIQSDGSNYRELYLTAKPVANTPDQIHWTKDGRTLFFIEDGRVMRLLPNNTPEFTGLSFSRPDRGHPISLLGDGPSQIAFSDGAPWPVSSKEMWVLENLGSVLKATR